MVKPFSAFSILVTENCNLACTYCYERSECGIGHNNNSMSKETAEKLVEFMFKESPNDVSVTFFGGEPTLEIDIIDYICTLSKKKNKPFNAGIITNATCMNEKIYNIIRKHLDVFKNCQLSIDGPEEIQNLHRITRSGKGSFKLVEKNIEHWKELFGKSLNIHGVLNPLTISNLFESYKYFREKWGVERLWFLPAKSVEYSKKDVDEYDIQLGKIYNYIMNIVRKTNSTREIDNYAPLDRALREGKANKPCGIGDNYCAVTSNGDIYPCHHMYYIDKNKETKLGDIYNGVDHSKKMIWSCFDNSDLQGCENCDHPSCYRCVAENFEEHGTPFTQIKGFHCDFMKVDLKYQRKIIEELKSMGLMKNANQNQNSNCLSNVRDCVGKQGECPVVTSVDECKFDNAIKNFSEIKKKDYIDVASNNVRDSNIESSPPQNNNIKDTLDKVIALLVDLHNKM